jgi:uncharacterized membrane protein YkvA (DUF1232 family)
VGKKKAGAAPKVKKADVLKQIRETRGAAKEYAANPEKAQYLVSSARKKAQRNKNALVKIWDELMALFRLIGAWAKGKYRPPWRTVILAIVAIIYFVNPFDLVPDFIPVFGYVDDVGVVGAILALIRGDVNHFMEWEEKAGRKKTKGKKE